MDILFLQTTPSLIWEVLANQILPIMLLSVAVWWFNSRDRIKDQKIDTLYKIIMDDNKEDKERLIQVIEGGNRSMERIAEILERLIVIQSN